MERVAKLQIKKLPEGFYLATSDDLPGLVVQAETVAETIEIARDVATQLMQASAERGFPISLPDVEADFDYPLILSFKKP